MLRNIFVLSLLKEVPAVICTAGSYIAAKNALGEKLLGSISEGEHMFDRMTPEHVLQYEAHFETYVVEDVYSFPVEGVPEYPLALAVFDLFFGKRIAAVYFFSRQGAMNRFLRSYCAKRKPPEPTGEEKMRVAHLLLKVPEDSYQPFEWRGLIDLRTATKAVVRSFFKAHPSFSLSVSYSENDQMKQSIYMPEQIAMSTYVQIMQYMLLTCEAVSRDGQLSITVERDHMDGTVRFCTAAYPGLCEATSSEELAELCPGVASYLSLCKYVVTVSKAELLVSPSEDKGSLELVLYMKERYFDHVDFKSRDPLLYFDECFEFADKYVSIVSENSSGNAE
ncbi:MAG: hypothetical protein IJD22_07545 [Clostridia bacterium]|nr:hypothetical protein [Clostridia bacterium]